MDEARPGRDPLQEAPAQDARQAAIQPDSSGAEFGPLGVRRHPTGCEKRKLRRKPSACCVQASAVAAATLLNCRAAVEESTACHRLPLKWG